jgi:hypothetical protein
MLTQKRVDRDKEPGRYRDGEVKGLCLKVTGTGAKSWVLRYERHGKEHFMGLGSASEFTLKEARERARTARQLLADGIDPLADRQAKQAAARLAEARKITFRQAAQRYFDQNEKRWTNASHRDSFRTPMRRCPSRCCAYVVIGHAAAPLISVMNSRRLIRSPRRRGQAATAAR